MGKSPLLADFIHTRACKPICAKLLTLPTTSRNFMCWTNALPPIMTSSCPAVPAFCGTRSSAGSSKSKGLPVIRREPLAFYNVIYAAAFLHTNFSYGVADHSFQCWHREIATIFCFPLFFLCNENPVTIPLMNRMKRTNRPYTDLLLYPRHHFSDYYFITRMSPTPYSFSCIHITASCKATLSPPIFCALRILCFKFQ